MASYDNVRSALLNNNSKRLEQLNADLMKQIEGLNTKSVEELLGGIDDTKSSLARNFGAEIFISTVVRQQKKCTAIR